MNETSQILAAIYKAIEEFNLARQETDRLESSPETRLFGSGAKLDSLALVHLLVGIEQQINDTFRVNLTLASDRAMSRQRSPFRTVQTLAEFVGELLAEQGHGT